MNTTGFEGRTEFQRCVIESIQWAAAQGCPAIHAWDSNFADWPLSDSSFLEAVQAWVGHGRVLHLLALNYDEMTRRHPKFVRWRRDFGHCVSARAVEPELRLDGAPQSLLLLGGGGHRRSLRLFEHRYWRGEVSDVPADWQRGWEWIDAVAQRSSEAFASTTLGL